MSSLVTAEQMGERLSLAAGTIKRWASEGIIPCLKLSGKIVRFDPEEVEKALKQKAMKTRKVSGQLKPSTASKRQRQIL